jgi:hypothetical protein
LELVKAAFESLVVAVVGIVLLELYIKAFLRMKNPHSLPNRLLSTIIWLTFCAVVVLPVGIIPLSLFKPLLSRNLACAFGLLPELSLLIYGLIFKRKDLEDLNRRFSLKNSPK